MSFRRTYALITALLPFLALSVHSADEDFDSLVSAEWLHENLDSPNVVVLDASVTVSLHDDGSYSIDNGRAAYEAGHIPGAGFADLRRPGSAMPCPRPRCSLRRWKTLASVTAAASFSTTPTEASGRRESGGCCAGSASTMLHCWMVDSPPGRRLATKSRQPPRFPPLVHYR